MDWLLAHLRPNACSMFLIVMKFPFIPVACSVSKHAMAFFLVVDKSSNVAITIMALKRALSMSLILYEGACILVPVGHLL